MNLFLNVRMLVRGGWEELRRLILAHPIAAFVALLVTGSGVYAHLALGLSWPRALYETARIFFDSADTSIDALEDAPGRTVPPFVVGVLWADRFLAPVLVAGAVLEVVRRVGRHGAVRPWWRGHVVVAGAGSLGTALARHHVARGHNVVVIEMKRDNPNLEGLRSVGVTVIEGDVRQRETLARARVERAGQLLAVTGDDIANFSALLQAGRLLGHRRIRAHALVADEDLRGRLLPLLARQYTGSPVLFDAFGIAARDLCALPRLLPKEGPAILVVAGYGKFGRAVADEVVRVHLTRPDLGLWIVDPNPGVVTERVSDWARAEPERVRLEVCDMLDRRLWTRLIAALTPEMHVGFAICTDSDARNVAFALAMRGALRGHCSDIHVVIRMMDWSEAEADLLQGVSVVALKDLVIEGLSAQ